jgi:hypothetical protein
MGGTEVSGAHFLRVDGEVAEVGTGGVSAGVKQATDPTFLHISGEGADLDCRKQDFGPLGRQQFVSDGAQGVCIRPGRSDSFGPSAEACVGRCRTAVKKVVDATAGSARAGVVLTQDTQRRTSADS